MRESGAPMAETPAPPDADLANADVWNADFDNARNRPASVQEALIEPFVVRERR